MESALKYGKQNISFRTPVQTEFLRVSEPESKINKHKFLQDFERSLPTGSSKFTNVGIVVADKTRLCGYPLYLPWILELLYKKGAAKNNIKIYIAYGTHPKQTDEESLTSYGDAFKVYNFVHHDCNDEAAMTQLGTTSRGTAVKVRRDMMASSLLITFGAISHHYFAGYGGGRKLIFPGLADRKSIYSNHGLFLDRKNKKLEEHCQPGKLEGNPIAEDLAEVDSFMPPKISIYGILNPRGEVINLIVGSSYKEFTTACKVHDSYYRSGIDKQFDLVIASSGGYPKDINFIQAHKSIHYAAAFVKDGGKLILLSECIDGIASNYFLKYLEAGSFEKAFAMLEANYEGNGGTALSMMTKTSRINIHMMTSLDETLCKTLNVTKVNELDIKDMLDAEKASVAFISNASLLVK